jgi:CRISPR-associated endonuclease/helicase Cas3
LNQSNKLLTSDAIRPNGTALKNIFYAHSGELPDKSDWQKLNYHLHAVAKLAGENAIYFGGQSISQMAGLLHDLGKYSDKFQARLEGSSERADHSSAGAIVAVEKWGLLGKLLAYVIAGHHAGLANGVDDGNGRSTLQTRLNLLPGKDIPVLDDIWQSEIMLPVTLMAPALKGHSTQGGFQTAFLIRMLFSCLVDADFIDTDDYYRQLEGLGNTRGDYPNLAVLRERINETLEKFQKSDVVPMSDLNQLRQHILNHSREQAILPTGLFSLTVPTGGGKTLTSMAFALDHANIHQLRRVIYVIPFTSIIEQNAGVFREAFGDLSHCVVEHHSAFDDKNMPHKDSRDKLKQAMENWDAPIVVTTAVQFFESLFADRPSQCRKLHNISGSVIILDEAQVLPLKLLRPIMAAIDELARNYQCSIVLCTATQPALQAKDLHGGLENVREIAPEPKKLFEQLRRTQVKSIGMQNDVQLVQQLSTREQVLMIVNNRRHARALFEAIKDKAGARHLTTLMCAKHRSKVLNEVRQDLKDGKPCRLISTSLIEAGVDVDFPCVLRAEAGLDSIAQAAGRCNREGKRDSETSEVLIFQSPEWKAPPELDQLAGNMREVLRNHTGDLLDPDAMLMYFKSVYWNKGAELDSKKILATHHNHAHSLDFPFQNIAREFRMIDSYLMPVIVPFNMEAEKLITALRFSPNVGGIARQLQPYLVQIPRAGFNELVLSGAVQPIAPERLGDQFWELINKDIYSDEAGLSWDNPTYLKAESTVI